MNLSLFEEVGDLTIRRADDFYETRVWQTEALLRRVFLHPAMRVVEPCAGNGAISKRLMARGIRPWSNDIVQRDFPLDSTLDAAEGLWPVVAETGPIDAVITNVPFSDAFAIVAGAVKAAGLVAILLRSTFDEPTEDRGEWLRANPPTAQIVMPRVNYRGAGTSTDSVSHHWFIWARYLPFHHDTVTPSERDALIAEHGKGAHGRVERGERPDG